MDYPDMMHGLNRETVGVQEKYMIRLYKMFTIKLYMFSFVLCKNCLYRINQNQNP